ncbi:cytidine deaminase-like isoform X1 [Ptychodera flava]|uniref:cytidine deaminase-like isoform X1 n=1 Tax=Ptychodera flava TaxID=63121 RepID=UPI00396A117E
MDQDKINKLILDSQEAKEKAYCPYSKFRVGCALITEDGSVFTGCNVENASYGLAICAERTAIVKAISEGHHNIKALVISSDMKNQFIRPCGMCRQFIFEFGKHISIYQTKPDKSYEMETSSELLPKGFGPSDLAAETIS